MTQFYSAYGLALESRSVIPGLANISSLGEALPLSDRIVVEIGEPPLWLKELSGAASNLLFPDNGSHTGFAVRLYALGAGEYFCLQYPDGARFAVDESMRHLWAFGPPSLCLEDLAIYLVGPVLGFILRQRRVLALHASCFSSQGFAFAVCGGPGTGKSTTAAALALRGVSILCEDISALRVHDGNFWVAPAYPRINLWPESVLSLLGNAADLPAITPTWSKRFLPLDGHTANFETQTCPLAAIYVLEPRRADASAPSIEPLESKSAVVTLVQNTYMNYLLNKSQRAAELDVLARVVTAVPVRRVAPHADPKKIPELRDLLLNDAAAVVSQLHTQKFAAQSTK